MRANGRVAAIVYSTPERNSFFSIPVSIIRKRTNLPAPAPGQPGPLSLGGAGVLENVLCQAGFTSVQSISIAAPLRMASAAECVRFQRESFGALHQMLSSLDGSAKEAVWNEIAGELRQFEGAQGFEGPCELVIASGEK